MNSRQKGPVAPPCVCAALRMATRSVTQVYDKHLRPSGLRSTQFHVLSAIRAVGEATVTRLTKILLIDQTTLTRGLALLERDGLVRTVPQPDGRLKSLRLTKKGESALESAEPLWAAAQKQILGVLGPNAWPELSRELDRLARGV